MNRSQYLPYTAYSITPYPPQLGTPGYHNLTAMTPPPDMSGSSAPLAYPPPTYNNLPAGMHQQQPHQNLSAWPYSSGGGGGGYAPVPGQIEDIVSPSSASPPGLIPTPVQPGGGGGRNGMSHQHHHRAMHHPHHPSNLPQVQDVFGPRQPPPFSSHLPGGGQQITQMPNGTSRMVGAYPPGQSQGSSPTGMGMGMPQRPRMTLNSGFPPPAMGMGRGGGGGGGGIDPMILALSGPQGGGGGEGGGGAGYRQFSMSP